MATSCAPKDMTKVELRHDQKSTGLYTNRRFVNLTSLSGLVNLSGCQSHDLNKIVFSVTCFVIVFQWIVFLYVSDFV